MATARLGDLILTGGYVTEPAAPDVAAAYLTVTNKGAVADRLSKVTSNVTTDVHAMTETTAGAVGAMTDITSVSIPAHGSIKLTRGHAHLMLESPNRRLKTGQMVSLTITFARAGSVTMSLPVVPLTTGSEDSSSGGMKDMPGMG